MQIVSIVFWRKIKESYLKMSSAENFTSRRAKS